MAKKALLIDDEQSLREILVELLELWGIETTEAEDAEQALEFIDQNETSFDLIFIDVNLPNMGGRELYEQLLPKFPETKFIFMSGYQRDHDLIDIPTRGDFVYLKKPFHIAELKSLIDQLLGA